MDNNNSILENALIKVGRSFYLPIIGENDPTLETRSQAFADGFWAALGVASADIHVLNTAVVNYEGIMRETCGKEITDFIGKNMALKLCNKVIEVAEGVV